MSEMTLPKKVYLAGDLVFRPDATLIFERLKILCSEVGVTGLAPFDGQESAKGLPPSRETTMTIIKADRDLMDICDGGIFCLDPFRRSADMDPGTAVEIGYMTAQNKPLQGYTVDGRSYPDKVASYWNTAWGQSLRTRVGSAELGSGNLEDQDGMLVHSEGMLQNGMIDGFIALSGGTVSIDTDFYKAFSLGIRELAARL